MPIPEEYIASNITRADIDHFAGPSLIDFGTNWCQHCEAARAMVDAAVSAHPSVLHRRIEDGKGRPLGRSFRITLWPTLIFLRDGVEIARLTRPRDQAAVEQALSAIVD